MWVRAAALQSRRRQGCVSPWLAEGATVVIGGVGSAPCYGSRGRVTRLDVVPWFMVKQMCMCRCARRVGARGQLGNYVVRHERRRQLRCWSEVKWWLIGPIGTEWVVVDPEPHQEVRGQPHREQLCLPAHVGGLALSQIEEATTTMQIRLRCKHASLWPLDDDLNVYENLTLKSCFAQTPLMLLQSLSTNFLSIIGFTSKSSGGMLATRSLALIVIANPRRGRRGHQRGSGCMGTMVTLTR
jgi:hypothetical protein